MIPKVNGRGHSFKGITAYLMHDKDRTETSERVTWTHAGNVFTQDPLEASYVMIDTAYRATQLKEAAGIANTGREATAGNVYHYSLSWAHGETPDTDHMKTQALETLSRLGLSEHQFYMVAHDDTDHAHLHIVVNLIHPDTGKIHSLSYDQHCLQGWALDYEKRYGMHCIQREKNALEREAGTPLKHREQKQDYSLLVTEAYQQCDNGVSFQHALREQGLELAAARRGAGFLIVDANGDVQKLARQLELDGVKGRAKTDAINIKLSDIDRAALPDADALAAQMHEARQEVAQEDNDTPEHAVDTKKEVPPPLPDAIAPPPSDAAIYPTLTAEQAVAQREAEARICEHQRLSPIPLPKDVLSTVPPPSYLPHFPPVMPVENGAEMLESTANLLISGVAALGRMIDAVLTWAGDNVAMLYEQLSMPARHTMREIEQQREQELER